MFDPASSYHSDHLSHANSQSDKLKPYPCPGRKSRAPVLWGILALVLLLAAGFIILGNSPDYFPPALAQQLPLPVLFLIAIGIILVLALLQKIFWRTPLHKFLAWTIGFAVLTFVVMAVFWGFFINPYVGMTSTSFLRNSVSINNGATLHLQNPADGVTQTLCIGVDQKCQPEDGAPDALKHEIQLQPGQRVTITFDTDGDYHITSKTTPGMNLSVDVSTPDDSGSY